VTYFGVGYIVGAVDRDRINRILRRRSDAVKG
jgi:hypothetical protein